MRDRSENQITAALIRHGATQANEERRYLGKTDEALSPSGREALVSDQARGCYPEVDYVFASPMKRCLETAAILYPKQQPVVIPEWEEMDFGQFEYKNYAELKHDPCYQAWLDRGGTGGFPGGECREDFILRCGRGWDQMCGRLYRLAAQGQDRPVRAGVIVHGGTIMALLHAFGGKNYFDCQAANGRGYLCSLYRARQQGRAAQGDGTHHIQIKVVADI